MSDYLQTSTRRYEYELYINYCNLEFRDLNQVILKICIIFLNSLLQLQLCQQTL